MEPSTIFLILALALLLGLLLWIFTRSSSPFEDQTRGWRKLNEEQIGILDKTKPFSGGRMMSQLSYSNPMEDYIKMGYGIATEQRNEIKQYLVPTDEIQHQLEVVDISNSAQIHSTPTPTNNEEKELIPEAGSLRRVVSTDSIDSTNSSVLDMGVEAPAVHLVLTYHESSQMFSVQVEKVTDVCAEYGQVWLLFFLLPHPKPLWRTEARSTPASVLLYNTIFQQCVKKEDVHKIALLVQLYSSRQQNASIIGQCRLRLKDVNIARVAREVPVVLSLLPSRHSSLDSVDPPSLGEILFFATFSRDTLTVVVSKLKGIDSKYKTVFVRLYVVLPMGHCVKKKTSEREIEEGKAEISESMFFQVNTKKLQKGALRLSIVCTTADNLNAKSIGHVTLGPKTGGREFGHWTRALNGDGSQVATWHSIMPRNTKIQ